jgi:hypothetical protein
MIRQAKMVRLKESTLESGLLSAEEFDKRVRPERKFLSGILGSL